MKAVYPHRAPGPAAKPARQLIGAIMRETSRLTEPQIDHILAFQRKHGLRFGEAAVSLRFAEHEAVLQALSRQFQYPAGFAGRDVNLELIMAADPFCEQAEAFRELRSRLLLEVLRGRPPSALAVVSADMGDGKTYLASNLAIAFSQLGERTLLIDADLRTPRQQHMFGIDASSGLSSVLAGLSEPASAIAPVAGLPSLYLLPAGAVPPNPLELLQRPMLGMLLHEALQQFKHILVDTPASMRGADSRVIAAHCGAAIAVGRRNRTRMDGLEGLLSALGRSGATVAGVVMNEH